MWRMNSRPWTMFWCLLDKRFNKFCFIQYFIFMTQTLEHHDNDSRNDAWKTKHHKTKQKMSLYKCFLNTVSGFDYLLTIRGNSPACQANWRYDFRFPLNWLCWSSDLFASKTRTSTFVWNPFEACDKFQYWKESDMDCWQVRLVRFSHR